MLLMAISCGIWIGERANRNFAFGFQKNRRNRVDKHEGKKE
jgi:hypothetical protein